jgi:putative hemolysin
MTMSRTVLVAGLVATLAGCSEPRAEEQPKPAAEDERGSVGPGSPAAIYCEKTGYEASGDACVFPDGTSCDQWAFYRAKCGQEHSYCQTHGGTITNEERDSGGFTVDEAICTVEGKRCTEEDFYRDGTCD